MPAPPARTALADTYPNPSNAAFRTGIGSFYDYSTGLLGADGTAATARTALGIGPVISFRNRVINGNFLINQRNVTGTVVLAAGAYGHDRWKAGSSGCTYTFSTSGVDTVITITAGSLVQVIEGAYVEGGSYCMSWFGTAQGKIGGGSFAASGVTAAGVTAGANLSIEFGTGTLTRVQLDPGTVPTPYERRGSLELVLCRRYLPAFIPSGTNDPVGTGQCVSSTVALVSFPFDVTPRIPPTGIIANSAFAITSSTGADLTLTGLTFLTSSFKSALLQCTVSSGLTAGDATTLQAKNAASFVYFTGCEI